MKNARRPRRIRLLLLLTGFLPFSSVFAAPTDSSSPPSAVTRLDIDALAGRMKLHQDLYKAIRDEALADYTKRNPNANPLDEKNKTIIRLFAYLTVWDDFYGEGLWGSGERLARDIFDQQEGAPERLVHTFINIAFLRGSSAGTEEDEEKFDNDVDAFCATDYPAAMKLKACGAALDCLAAYRERHPDAPSATLATRGHFVEMWGRCYRELLKQKYPYDLLFSWGDQIQNSVKYDEPTLDLAIAEIDRDFNEVDPHNPQKLVLDGGFFIHDAWCARGGDTSDTVTDSGWQLFAERLSKAQNLLEPLYEKYPNDANICLEMMTVELGQGKGRDRMELWFQRGVKAAPGNFALYKAKEWYLLPRWYGSMEDDLAFGRECVKTGDWADKLPLIFTYAVSESADGNPEPYARPDLWAEIDKVYRGYLNQYPDAVYFRTCFAKHAYEGGHLDVALDQLRVMRDHWDNDVIPEEMRAAMLRNPNGQTSGSK